MIVVRMSGQMGGDSRSGAKSWGCRSVSYVDRRGSVDSHLDILGDCFNNKDSLLQRHSRAQGPKGGKSENTELLHSDHRESM